MSNEIGVDVLNPVQPECLDPTDINRKWGDQLSFWGTIGTQTTLPFGTVDQIKAEVRERVEILSQGSGYVFGTIHNIQADITPEKILAVFDTARQTSVG